MTISALATDERVVHVTISEDELSVRLMDGRTISVPLAWYPRLLHASETQRNHWQIVGGGYGIHWPDIDEDLSAEGFLRGTPAIQKPARLSAAHRRDDFTSAPPAIGGGEAPEGMEMFDLLAEGEEAVETLTAHLSMFTELTTKIGEKISKHAESLGKINQSAGQKKIGPINKINMLAAADMNHYSKWVEELAPEIEKTIDKLNDSYVSFYQRIDPKVVDDWEAIKSDREGINSLLQTLTTTMQSARIYRAQIETLRGFSKHMNVAVARQIKALDGMITNFTHVESFGLRCIQIIDEKLASESGLKDS
jgi:hypothetical protein